MGPQLARVLASLDDDALADSGVGQGSADWPGRLAGHVRTLRRLGLHRLARPLETLAADRSPAAMFRALYECRLHRQLAGRDMIGL